MPTVCPTGKHFCHRHDFSPERCSCLPFRLLPPHKTQPGEVSRSTGQTAVPWVTRATLPFPAQYSNATFHFCAESPRDASRRRCGRWPALFTAASSAESLDVQSLAGTRADVWDSLPDAAAMRIPHRGLRGHGTRGGSRRTSSRLTSDARNLDRANGLADPSASTLLILIAPAQTHTHTHNLYARMMCSKEPRRQIRHRSVSADPLRTACAMGAAAALPWWGFARV